MITVVADPTMMGGGGAQTPLLPETDPRQNRRRPPPSSTVLPAVVSAVLLLVLAAVTVLVSQHAGVPAAGVVGGPDDAAVAVEVASSRGVAEGVSEKSTAPLLGAALRDYSWTNEMLAWQRTAFHFQPPKNWMNG
ncbi:hypothetical protein U9M48_033299 [Paspalum notatum var. saurae]|uniref:Beta-fructofuranosidase N-terminal domain-containing protein n=1 Tax=Paspalum notatum var. saurae TaxID=547442 RepID=A0AAQ3U740_PASNO